MASEDNPTYFLVGEQTNVQCSKPRRQNSETYDFVQPKPRAVSQQSVYEVPPPMSQTERGNGQECDAIPCPPLPSRSSMGQSSDVYENTSISTPQQENLQQRRGSDYDLVALPARRATLERPSYDVVPPPSQVPQVRCLPSFHSCALIGS